MIVGSLVHMSFLVAAAAMQDPLLPDCTGGNISAWLACRQNLINALFNASSLPSRSNPDYVVPMPNYAMHGFPGPGDGVGDVSGNSWSNNMTVLVWTIETPFITLNSTVYHTLNTSGRAPRNWPQDGPSMPGPAIVPTARGDTVVFYHNGHETNKCTPNYDGVVDHFNQLGYDVFEFFMPLYGCNGNTPYETSSHHEWFEQWELKGDFPLRFFIEPVILSVNYAVNVLGYKHVVLVGLSGGGWTTTVTAAVDPRIKLSIPIAGSVPKWPTTLYPNFVPDLPEVRPAWRCSRPRNSGVRARGQPSRPFVFTLTRPVLLCSQVAADFEQRPVRPFYETCSFVCMYMLAALEVGRSQAQVLHEADPCCYQVQPCPIPLIPATRFELLHRLI